MAILTSISTPADIANNALTRLGSRMRVGSLLDGSDASKKLLDVYGQTRDQLLAAFDYDFAQRTVDLTLLKSAPAGGYVPPNNWDPALYPPLGWRYEYNYPDDALKIRTVKPQQLLPYSIDPRPHNWTEYNDPTLNQRTIVTNVTGALCVYTGRITDPTQWDVRFSEAFAAELAHRIGPSFASPEIAKMEAGEAAMEIAQSEEDGR